MNTRERLEVEPSVSPGGPHPTAEAGDLAEGARRLDAERSACDRASRGPLRPAGHRHRGRSRRDRWPPGPRRREDHACNRGRRSEASRRCSRGRWRSKRPTAPGNGQDAGPVWIRRNLGSTRGHGRRELRFFAGLAGMRHPKALARHGSSGGFAMRTENALPDLPSTSGRVVQDPGAGMYVVRDGG
jgi:hypothetical protein